MTLRFRSFISVSTNETQSISSFNDEIPLQARKAPIEASTVYTGAELDESSCGRQETIFKPRSAPAHHFWNEPLGFGTVIFVGDILLTASPCLFLILTFQALTVSGKPISTIEQAARLGPTLFPIVFAAVVGRLMRTFALWKAERGAP